MSMPSVLLGYILEPRSNDSWDVEFVRQSNDAVLSALPLDDDASYPPLCRSMFAAGGCDTRHGAFRGGRVIHFAGNFNYVTQGLDLWLDKFERLLSTLYWFDAEVFANGGGAGPSLVLKYTVAPGSVDGYRGVCPKLPAGWQLRTFGLDTWKRLDFDVSEFVGASRAASRQSPEAGDDEGLLVRT